MYRKFIKREGNGFTSCYMCASKEKYSSEWDKFLYTDTKYGLPICYKCILEKMKETNEEYVIEVSDDIVIEFAKYISEQTPLIITSSMIEDFYKKYKRK